jgi:TonB system transport protein ExbD (group 1)
MGAALTARGGRWTVPQNADINVTPFVDVMLVLLIIFMVALPVATVSVKVDLPTAAAGQQAQPPVIVSLTLDGSIFVGDRRTSLADLPSAAAAALGPGDKRRPIHLRADKGVSYGELMKVMNRLRLEGYDKIGLVGEEL